MNCNDPNDTIWTQAKSREPESVREGINSAQRELVDLKSHGVDIADQLKALTEAELLLSGNAQAENLVKARAALISALGDLCFKRKTLQQSRSFIGGYGILAFLVTATIVLFAYIIFETYYANNESVDIFNTRLLFVPVYIFLWGMLGTLAYLLWACLNHIAQKDFDNYYIPYYFLRLPMGAIMAAITYAVILAGFVSLTAFYLADNGDETASLVGNVTTAITGDQENGAEVNGQAAGQRELPEAPYIVIAFLAGFSVRFGINTLERIINAAMPNRQDVESRNSSSSSPN